MVLKKIPLIRRQIKNQPLERLQKLVVLMYIVSAAVVVQDLCPVMSGCVAKREGCTARANRSSYGCAAYTDELQGYENSAPELPLGTSGSRNRNNADQRWPAIVAMAVAAGFVKVGPGWIRNRKEIDDDSTETKKKRVRLRSRSRTRINAVVNKDIASESEACTLQGIAGKLKKVVWYGNSGRPAQNPGGEALGSLTFG